MSTLVAPHPELRGTGLAVSFPANNLLVALFGTAVLGPQSRRVAPRVMAIFADEPRA